MKKGCSGHCGSLSPLRFQVAVQCTLEKACTLSITGVLLAGTNELTGSQLLFTL